MSERCIPGVEPFACSPHRLPIIEAMRALVWIGAMLFCFTGAVFANSWDDPLKPFDATKRLSDRMDITWQIVDKPAARCEREARRRHPDFKGYGYQPDACAFWDERAKRCLIITARKPTMHDLGHEMRHCFQGHWH